MSANIERRVSAWTTRILICLPVLLASGCINVGSGKAICDGTANLRTVHAEALAEDGGDRSVVTGQSLIATLDAACS